jgi:hypothetical protein
MTVGLAARTNRRGKRGRLPQPPQATTFGEIANRLRPALLAR